MNILIVNEYPINPHYGGIERVTDLLTKAFVCKGYNVTYLSSRMLENQTNVIMPVPQLVLPYAGGFDNKDNIKYYRDLLHEYKIDIVINQRGWAPFMNMVLDANGIKTVSVIHSTPMGLHIMYMKEILRHNETFDGFWRYICKLLIYPCYWTYKYVKSKKKLLDHYETLLSHSAAVVVLSKECKRELEYITRRFHQRCEIVAIPNPNMYDQIQTNEIEKQNVILYVGRLCNNQKRPLRMLKIWQLLYKKHHNWKMIFVGEGDSLNAMKSYANNNKIERVEFVGQVTNVEQYYKVADFICLTSDFEGWGMVLTEGMSFGCIPFTFNNYGAASEIIDDGVNGCLIEPFDLSLYAIRLSELMQDPDRKNKMSKSALHKVKMFSVNNVVEYWSRVFDAVLHE